MQKNDIFEVEITGYTSEGQGVCRVDDRVLFVKGAVSGDLLKVKVIKVTSRVAYAIISEIIKPSDERVRPLCEISNKCGGCTLWNMTYDEELEFKREKVENSIKRIAGIDFDIEKCIGSDLTKRYRNKAQFPVREIDGRAVTGFFRANSHEIVPMSDCLIQTEKSNEIANFIVDFMNKYKISAYNEQRHSGLIRHIYIRTGFRTGQIQLCLVSTSFDIENLDVLADKLQEKFPKIVSFMINENSQKTNQIIGKEFETVFGETALLDVLCENTFEIEPNSFYQVNRSAAEKLYEKAIEYCDFKGSEVVLDMYCGVGTITLAVAKHVKEVTGIEIVPEAIESANKNAKINNIVNVNFITGDAKDAVKRFESEKIDVVIVDPPRKGLDTDTIQSIIKINPEKIAYISCDPATLARDIKEFVKNGYKLTKGSAHDLFPKTFHVESAVLLVR